MKMFMCVRDTLTSYGLISKLFHWGMALLVISLICVGLYMDSMPLGPEKLKLYGLHKSFGVLVLMLAVLRIGWRFSAKSPMLLGMPRWMMLAARSTHASLYALLFLMPLSGWAMSAAAGFPVSFFGLFLLPPLVGPDNEMKHIYAEAHEYMAYLLILIIVVHASAALWHHFVRRDDTLRRMLIRFRVN